MKNIQSKQLVRLLEGVTALLPASHCALLGAAAGIAMITAPDVNATPIQSSIVNTVVPNNIDGLYMNVETGVTGSAAGLVAGWDLNPYGTSTTALSWFASSAPSGEVMGGGKVANLPIGTLVGVASTFGNVASTTTASTFNWNLNELNYFGFRFNAADALTHYGWGSMLIGATMGVREVKEIWYESLAATGITVVGPVLEPSQVPEPTAMLLMALGGAGLLAFRRRRFH